MFDREVVEVIVNDHVIKLIGNLEGIIKASRPSLMGTDNLVSWVDLLAALSTVPKRLANLWSGGVFLMLSLR